VHNNYNFIPKEEEMIYILVGISSFQNHATAFYIND